MTAHMGRMYQFVSVILVVKNEAEGLELKLRRLSDALHSFLPNHEILVVDNASTDLTLAELERLTRPGQISNMHVFALNHEVDKTTGFCLALENALGDVMITLDNSVEHFSLVSHLLEEYQNGAEVVFALNSNPQSSSRSYTMLENIYHALYRHLNGFDLREEAPYCRLMNRSITGFILKHKQPELIFRNLPVHAQFSSAKVHYAGHQIHTDRKSILGAMDRGIQLLISSNRLPMRLSSILCLFGASANILYSFYVLAIWIFKQDVEPGWVSLSLQQSGMFFLISLVLLVLSEYVLQLVKLSKQGPGYQIEKEFTSSKMSVDTTLNVVEGM